MHSHHLSLLSAFTVALCAHPAGAQTFQLLYSFTGGADGGTPWAAPLLHNGVLYGTTFAGGTGNAGVVYQLDIRTGQQTVLHAFQGGNADGGQPIAALIRDKAGNLYGAADQGGAYGYGAVFQLQPSGTIKLFSPPPKSGKFPQATLVRDTQGNFYTTADAGGPYRAGSVLQMDTAGRISELFQFNITDGGGPKFGPLVLSNGSLYGTTYFGGTYGNGTVYSVSLATGQETVLYSFTGGADGWGPLGGLAADSAGNLYGTTEAGGSYSNSQLCLPIAPGCGTVFKLDPSGNLTTLHSFAAGSDGALPQGSVILDSQGNLYGTTNGAGYVHSGYCRYGCGTVFRIDAAGVFTTLHAFIGPDGGGMFSGVTLGAGGILYGASDGGGAYLYGTLFALKP